MLLLPATGDSKSELTIQFVVGLVGSPPPGMESVAPAAIVRLSADSVSPGAIVTVAPLVAIETSVAEVGTASSLQLAATSQ